MVVDPGGRGACEQLSASLLSACHTAIVKRPVGLVGGHYETEATRPDHVWPGRAVWMVPQFERKKQQQEDVPIPSRWQFVNPLSPISIYLQSLQVGLEARASKIRDSSLTKRCLRGLPAPAMLPQQGTSTEFPVQRTIVSPSSWHQRVLTVWFCCGMKIPAMS